MRRPLSLAGALALLALALPAAARAQGATDGGPKIGDLAPDFTLPASTKNGIRPTPVNLRALDRKSTRLNSSHTSVSRMPSSA